jgi:hypothetical protein
VRIFEAGSATNHRPRTLSKQKNGGIILFRILFQTILLRSEIKKRKEKKNSVSDDDIVMRNIVRMGTLLLNVPSMSPEC